jgi:hypothetical protein
VAEHLECSTSKISRIETGRVSVSPRDVRDMLDLYGVSAPQRDNLVQLARESRQKGWWHAYSDAIEPRFATYIGLESAASAIRIYEVTLIPGLLQTEDYARAVIAAGSVDRGPEAVERNVAFRMARQPIWAPYRTSPSRSCRSRRARIRPWDGRSSSWPSPSAPTPTSFTWRT